MEARELRIGNYISDIHASEKFFSEVKQITPYRVFYGGFHSHPLGLKPIPLTEQWLIDLGLKKDSVSVHIYTIKLKDGYFIQYNLIEKSVFLGGYDSCVDTQGFLIESVNYVHELQNLYFALKKQELTLKNEL